MKHVKSQIWPSIMAKDQKELDGQLQKASLVSEVVHLDFVDGKFAPNKVLQFPFKLKRNLEYSAHLMINNPLPFIKKHKRRIQLFIPHFEVFKNPANYLKFCKREKIVSAFALLPTTKFSDVKSYLDSVDFVLVLTVTPGFYGSKFQKSQLRKIKSIKNYIKKHKLSTRIVVDGSMNKEHIKPAKEAGVDIFISGSYLMKSDNIRFAMKKLEKAIK